MNVCPVANYVFLGVGVDIRVPFVKVEPFPDLLKVACAHNRIGPFFSPASVTVLDRSAIEP